ncbi:UDP-N-acetylmuramate--L-alanine ligase,bifunctional D-alanyl-alanine synthetase A/UDP-N-acetylmuramate--L-alanine ligase,Folylpolyglutamate synthase,UDP-N-acetylmuramate--alanine ligase,D-ala D-ala ligase C-terminus [Chlamydia serpentis]|uniref:Multifunctional fusion protein n=1 Tax=Chlamydia serpentis TaxID=1967782 RepID=A0A2R8FC54_9CHLA|nr:bifunctional UDP-N-acetylmuramate--L-alanine ligase/D-alanine--D-alanine ligase [Chlamydia serpentis]SPN74015.1 UDP-N-acetylmuramate--L-alanine ligase,bifunctional D-alanyl-alanine synthetase A/UDP-N-acetylmuramate--L-alanine ligase,Folylpolyglutamate synthase,UDP-N-acetylmuramate--alanine ligase,D-ala D-ala ligase C-terminus [Chlamydia serpentis]
MIENPHYHFIGIGGIGMSALAHILLDRGYYVSGSDLSAGYTINTLKAKGAECFLGHDATHISDGTTVVYSSSIASDNVEYLAAVEKSLPLIHRAELLSQLMEGYQSILVSGSHGKTSTSSLIRAIFQEAQKDPSYAIGGVTSNCLNGYSGSSNVFIAEADESDGSLKYYYNPDALIITNLDNEHLSNYGGSLERLLKVVQDFSSKAQDSNKVFYNGDCPILRGKIKGISFGYSPDCQLRIVSYSQKEWQSQFSFIFLGQEYRDIELNLPGQYNAANAAAACGIALTFGIEITIIRKALKEFVGVCRRLEKKNNSEGFLFLEDYAHHPVEVASTLRAVRDAVGLRRVIAIFQPHRFSRLQECLNSFPTAFQEADEVILTDVYSAGEKDTQSIILAEFAKNIARSSHVRCHYISYGDLVDYLKAYTRIHDVCVSLGAGNIYTIGDSLKDFNPRKLSLGLVCGGKSCEHDISLLSAQHISRYISPTLYDVTYFIIDRQGLWRTGKNFAHLIEESQSYSVLSTEITLALSQVDCLFPVLHGPLGEDGAIQGFFEILGKPYIGPNLPLAAIAMDKLLTKRIASAVGIPVVPYQPLNLSLWKRNPELCIHNLIATFAFPMIVKTSHLGSSIGIFLVHNEEQLREKISEAFLYDTDVFVEESRLGSREIELSCIGDSSTWYCIEGPNERRGASGFIDYQEKYGFGGVDSAKITFDLQLSQESLDCVKEFADRLYRALHGKGLSRIDFFLDEEGNYWLSEVNPIPGMTAGSPFLQAFVRAGWTKEQVVNFLVIEALHKFDKKQMVECGFNKDKTLIRN